MLVGHPCLDKWPQPHDGADSTEWSQWVIKEMKGENDPLRYYKEIKKSFLTIEKNVRVSCRDPRIIKRKQEEIRDACPLPLS